jgi:DNA polymerase-1
MNRTLLIDADITLYRAAAACEREVRWDDVNHVLVSNSEEAWAAVLAQIASYKTALGDHQMHFALSGANNFRRTLWDGYKGGRSRKPLCYGAIRDRLIEEFDARSVETLEADDLLGIWATNGKLPNPTIVSLDKDLRTIPTNVWRPASGTEGTPKYRPAELYEVTEDEADVFWMTQTLTGDVTDGYTGLPGCGPKSAEKLLSGAARNDLWGAVVAAYEAKGLHEDDALLQARLSRILRASDWDSEKKEVILWRPNTK